MLSSWTATDPYKVKQVLAGPAPTASVTFKIGSQTSTVTIASRAGVPTAVASEGQ